MPCFHLIQLLLVDGLVPRFFLRFKSKGGKCLQLPREVTYVVMSLPGQMTPASSIWAQLCCPSSFGNSLLHCSKWLSFPRQLSLFRKMGPSPWPKNASLVVRAPTAPSIGYPSWRHTTWALFTVHWSSQIVPHLLWKHNSTLPSFSTEPFISRISPFSHDLVTFDGTVQNKSFSNFHIATHNYQNS